MDVEERAELTFPGVAGTGVEAFTAEGSVGAAVSVWKNGAPIVWESFGSTTPVYINIF